MTFRFEPDTMGLNFKYVLCSNEYNEFVGFINNVFAFLVNV